MSQLTPADWQEVLVRCGVRAMTALDWRDAFAAEWQPDRFSQGMDDIVDLLPQVLHETGMLQRLEENLRYSRERIQEIGRASPSGSRWRSLVPRADALAYNPKAFAEACYGGRNGNRPEGSGDGWDFRGQGPIQFTGRRTFELLERLSEQDVYQDFTVNPAIVQQKAFGLRYTLLWWEGTIPDAVLGDQVQVRRRVNGGRIGLEHCAQLAEDCRRAFA
jgi:putative chitinase